MDNRDEPECRPSGVRHLEVVETAAATFSTAEIRQRLGFEFAVERFFGSDE